MKVAVSLFSLLVFSGAWFAVLYDEEQRRLASAAKNHDSYIARLEEIDQDRKAYFSDVAENRKRQKGAMDVARQQYDDILKTQSAKVKAQQKSVTQYVNKPVTKTETVKISKPKASTSTKTS